MATKEELHAAFVKELLDEVPADLRESVRASLEGSKKLKDGVLRQDEFSRRMDEVAAEKRRVDAEIAKAAETISGWQKWYQDTSTELTTKQDLVAQYEAKFGKLDANTNAVINTPGLTRAEIDKILEAEGQKFFNTTVDASDRLLDLKLKARLDFGEAVSTKDLLDIANKEKVTVERAFDIWAQPKIDAKREADIASKIAAAKEEGRREAVSGNLPLPGSNRGATDAVAFINSKLPGAAETAGRLDAAINDLNTRLMEKGLR